MLSRPRITCTQAPLFNRTAATSVATREPRADVDAPTKEGARRLQRDHGYVFEVPADGVSSAEPLIGLGQFRHEAACVHGPSGHVFLTEDMEPAALGGDF